MIDLDVFLQFLKGHCHGNQFRAKFTYIDSFGTEVFRNGLKYCHSNSKYSKALFYLHTVQI